MDEDEDGWGGGGGVERNAERDKALATSAPLSLLDVLLCGGQ